MRWKNILKLYHLKSVKIGRKVFNNLSILIIMIIMDDSLEKICRKLLEYDSNIVEIIQFGSSIHSPKYARDIDILVFTKRAKNYGGYIDAIYSVDIPFNIDLVVIELGKKLREEFLRGVLVSHKILYGSGKYLYKYVENLGDPSYEEAKSALIAARDYIELAEKYSNPLLRDRHAREAYNTLFHAARIAAMTYLSINISRWGLIRRYLPEPYKSEFEKYINILHIEYFYNGNYPKNKIKEEFEKWYKKIEKFIQELEQRSK